MNRRFINVTTALGGSSSLDEWKSQAALEGTPILQNEVRLVCKVHLYDRQLYSYFESQSAKQNNFEISHHLDATSWMVKWDRYMLSMALQHNVSETYGVYHPLLTKQ